MKLKRIELEHYLGILDSVKNIPNERAFSFAVMVNRKRFIKRIEEIDEYKSKTYDSLVKAAKKKDKKFDIEPAASLLRKFHNDTLQALTEKYAFTLNEKEEKVPYEVNGTLQVAPGNMVKFNAEADKEYKAMMAEIDEKYPASGELYKTQESKINTFLNKEVTIGLQMLNPEEVPSNFSASQMDYIDFMISIPEEEVSDEKSS